MYIEICNYLEQSFCSLSEYHLPLTGTFNTALALRVLLELFNQWRAVRDSATAVLVQEVKVCFLCSPEKRVELQPVANDIGYHAMLH